jgi:sialate O-acetylesterase
MAVTIDVGDPRDLHPTNKCDMGERLALWALAKDYNKKIVCGGPLYQGNRIANGKIILSFDHTGSGLMVGRKEGLKPAVEDKGAKLKRFAVAGKDKKWVWADAVIDGKTVVLSSPEVPQTVAARYAYSVNPAGCNLYNKEGLPASPFRTDDW